VAAVKAGERHIGQLTRRSETLEGWPIEPAFGQPCLTQHAGFDTRTVSELVEVGIVADSLDQTAGSKCTSSPSSTQRAAQSRDHQCTGSAPNSTTQLNARQQHVRTRCIANYLSRIRNY